MAKIGADPVPVAPAAAKAALEAHLPKVLRGQTLEEAGWVRPDPLTLLVPLTGELPSGERDEFLLRLHFGYYPEWPPSAIFVNPTTKRYSFPEDVSWVPKIEGTPEIQTHTNYNSTVQLICCSFTLEFYLVRHGVEEKHLWDSEKMTFGATLYAIRRGLGPQFYKGRHR